MSVQQFLKYLSKPRADMHFLDFFKSEPTANIIVKYKTRRLLIWLQRSSTTRLRLRLLLRRKLLLTLRQRLLKRLLLQKQRLLKRLLKLLLRKLQKRLLLRLRKKLLLRHKSLTKRTLEKRMPLWAYASFGFHERRTFFLRTTGNRALCPATRGGRTCRSCAQTKRRGHHIPHRWSGGHSSG